MVDVSERKFSKNMTFSEALELELKKPKKFTSHFVDPPSSSRVTHYLDGPI